MSAAASLPIYSTNSSRLIAASRAASAVVSAACPVIPATIAAAIRSALYIATSSGSSTKQHSTSRAGALVCFSTYNPGRSLTPRLRYPSVAILSAICCAQGTALEVLLCTSTSVPVVCPSGSGFAAALKWIATSRSTSCALQAATIRLSTSCWLIPLLQVQSCTVCPIAANCATTLSFTARASVDSLMRPTAPQAVIPSGLCPACMLILIDFPPKKKRGIIPPLPVNQSYFSVLPHTLIAMWARLRPFCRRFLL